MASDALFGQKKGAFAQAYGSRQGAFAGGNESTVFLDEIGDLHPDTQAALLSVTRERTYYTLGSDEIKRFKGRLISATKHDLKRLTLGGKFREDLFMRIATHRIHLPPLRERREDLDELIQQLFPNGPTLAEDCREFLLSYRFPGNVAELQSLLESARLHARGYVIRYADLPHDDFSTEVAAGNEPTDIVFPESVFDGFHDDAMEWIERRFNHVYLERMMKKTGHVVEEASKLCGFTPKTFRKKWNERTEPKLLPELRKNAQKKTNKST